jgi:uncharacterized delta-60 repeat protein
LTRRLQFESLDKRLCFAFGDLDTEFASAGEYVVSYETPSHREVFVYDILSVPGGYLVVSTTSPGSGDALTLTKVTESGAVDQSFGTSGHVYLTDTDGADFDSAGVTRLANGNILISQWSQNHSSIWSITPEGTIDESFGSEGVLRLGYFFIASNQAIAETEGGFFVITSDMVRPTSITRYKIDGTLDDSYADNGTASVRAILNPVAHVSPNGAVTVAGTSALGLELQRLKPDGSLDESFGPDGRVTDSNGDLAYSVRNLFFSPDGESVYYANLNSDDVLIVRKYNLDARLDRTFGINGEVRVPLGFDPDFRYYPELVIDSDGSIEVGFSAPDSAPLATAKLITMRLLPDGTLDPAYSDDGIATAEGPYKAAMHPFPNKDGGWFWTDGLLLGADQDSRPIGGLVVMRTRPSGMLDTDWGTDGMLFEDITHPSRTVNYLQLQQIEEGVRLHSGWPPYEPNGLRPGQADTFDS